MKKSILSTILLMSAIWCYSQNIDPLPEPSTLLHYTNKNKIQIDTFPALMLVSFCDTCDPKPIKGYAVHRKIYSSQISFVVDEFFKFLDLNKAILPKNCIIWQYKTF